MTIQLTRLLIGTISTTILVLWATAFLGIYTPWIGLLLVLIAALLIYKKQASFFTLKNTWAFLGFLIAFLVIYTLLALPLLNYHDGFPTGDSQKAVFWGRVINATGVLPNYADSIKQLNRDPVDFYTPGLHTLVAFVMSASSNELVSLYIVSFFSLAIAVLTAFLAGTIAFDLSGRRSLFIPFFTILFVLTNLRFLRYIREPGYHLQNGLGELLLFGLIWIAVTFRHRRRWGDILLASLLAGALVVSHQFSSFMAAFMLVPIFITFLFTTRSHFNFLWRYHRLPVIGALVVMIAALLTGASLGLGAKIPHIFSLTPHLLFEVPTLADYPRLFGLIALSTGLVGLFLMLRTKKDAANTSEQRVFVASAFVILVLSQGPRFGIDIPPIRALLYLAIPLSIGTAFFLDFIYSRLKWFGSFAVTIVVCVPVITSTTTLQNISHTMRTNSTLQPTQLAMINLVSKQATHPEQAVLVDDYNQRALSWLLLSSQPTFSRIGADISKQMDESRQSSLRRMLYLNQLDYEKIFALGNRPEVAALLHKHSIRWVGSTKGLTDFERKSFSPSTFPADIQNWLLRSSTLINDIGDDQDTFEHLPVSLRTTRLSGPVQIGNETWRTTTAPHIPLAFNIGDYVRVLWSQTGLFQPDQAVELLIVFKNNPKTVFIKTTDGKEWPLTSGKLTRIESKSLKWDAKGFIMLEVQNPNQELLSIDFVALGLARIP